MNQFDNMQAEINQLRQHCQEAQGMRDKVQSMFDEGVLKEDYFG